ncbi:ATP-dependent helicase [Desulfopila aestuarii]|uniref:DNA 3'-5' helicase n=1 Tax=Desulfopila aestuarii DSM 18488 TaxID=1121416 RepID=A0A1M7XZ21_9BACT|nr:ATP-dependent helicase [Desulfopila aestuarii]SHO44372.1 DNA helicase-2 / ATP-dependent DNA helicase PcrA [Desulfopila aestuarii DSM 18488]
MTQKAQPSLFAPFSETDDNELVPGYRRPATVGVNLDDLNEAQYQAVTTIDGPVLVIAGAGSGKTRTLVYRVAHLIENGVAPESILLLTFTRKASQEMLWRAGRLLNESCSRVTGGTFHSVANLLLRRYGGHIGYGSSFTIIDRADAEGIVNLLKSSLGFTGKNKQFPSKRVILNMISGSINKSLKLEDLVTEQYAHLTDHLDDIVKLEQHYQTFKYDHGLMDYDDLLVNWKRLLEEAPDVRETISRRFSHIMVDEYQDTNLIQADIVRLCAHTHNNVMVVGDDSQSIYAFRGADFYNIMRFPKVFPDCRIVKLEENYRSCQPILSLTNDIINNATEKYTKTLFTRIAGDLKPRVCGVRDERDEARFVVRKINELRRSGTPLEEIAVLFRSGFHSYKLEMELNTEGLDFEKRGGLKLTESAHMKDVLAFLRLLVNPQDNLSWNRIFLQLDKVGPKTAQKITAAIATAANPFEALRKYPAGGSSKQGIAKLSQLFIDLHDSGQSPSGLYEIVMGYYEPIFQHLYADDFPKRQKDLDQLKSIMAGYSELQSFIDDTALDPPDDSTVEGDSGGEKVILSTIHSAKGLEFDAVFVIGLADGRFPHGSAAQGEQWEEERRLLYVAATRARQHLYLTYPRELMTPDRQFRRVGMSPFLAEISPGLYERVESGGDTSGYYRPATRYEPPVLSNRPKREKKLTLKDLPVGTKVQHPFFGIGTVKKTSAPSSLDVLFDRHGIKTLHLDYAKLKIM